jgi:hypothetical protein
MGCNFNGSNTNGLFSRHSFPHGMPTTEADTINADLLTFLNEPHQATASRGVASDARPFSSTTRTVAP